MSDTTQPKRAVVRFDFEEWIRVAERLGLPQCDALEFVSSKLTEFVQTFVGSLPDDIFFLDKNAVHTVSIGDRQYEVELFDAVGLECPHCHAALLPKFGPIVKTEVEP